MKTLHFIMQSLFSILMIGVVGLFLVPFLPIEKSVDLRIVESGSMEPAIMTGAMILVMPREAYAVGDVIMFESRNANIPTTHRVVEKYRENGQTWFVTKGDANEEADAEIIAQSKILGTVLIDIPRVGFVLDFARQPIGFMFLIVLPACLIIFSELEKIWRELHKRRRGHAYAEDTVSTPSLPTCVSAVAPIPAPKKTCTQAIMMDIATPVRFYTLPTLDLRTMTPYKESCVQRQSFPRTAAILSVVAFSILVFGAGFLGSTVSYFNDQETSSGNALTALSLDVAAVSDGEVFNFVGDVIDDGDGAVVVTVMPESGSSAAHYDISAHITGSTTVLCDAIETVAAVPAEYTGPLSALSATDVVFDAPWLIAFSLPDESGLSSGELCEVELALTAWHDDALLGDGYYDEEVVPLTFSYTAAVFTLQRTSLSVPSASPAHGSGTPPPVAPETDALPESASEDADGAVEDTEESVGHEEEVVDENENTAASETDESGDDTDNTEEATDATEESAPAEEAVEPASEVEAETEEITEDTEEATTEEGEEENLENEVEDEEEAEESNTNEVAEELAEEGEPEAEEEVVV